MRRTKQNAKVELPKGKVNAIKHIGEQYKLLWKIDSPRERIEAVMDKYINPPSSRTIHRYIKEKGWKAEVDYKRKIFQDNNALVAKDSKSKISESIPINPEYAKQVLEINIQREKQGRINDSKTYKYESIEEINLPELNYNSTGYSLEQKETMFMNISLEYAHGYHGLHDLCAFYNLNIMSYHEVANINSHYKQIYLESKNQHLINFQDHIDELIRNSLIKELRAEYITEETLEYKVRRGDYSSNWKDYEELVSRKEVRRPVRLDSQLLKDTMALISHARNAQRLAQQTDATLIANKSIGELELDEKDLLKQLEELEKQEKGIRDNKIRDLEDGFYDTKE